MGKSHGQNHPMAHARKMTCPFGEFDFIKTGEHKSAGKTYKTTDGEEHAAGQIEAYDIACEMYLTDRAKVQSIVAWHALVKNALPGYKVPATWETLGEGGAPGSVWQDEYIFPKDIGESSGDENSAGAATMPIVFSVYNSEKVV